ncbi:MAG: TolC family protein [Bryobacteraceae bacterium]|jgi:outer membrane protein
MRLTLFLLAAVGTVPFFGQTGVPVQLKLSDAEVLALKNHPQVLAAQNETSAQSQRIVEARSAYYPTVDGEMTGSGANIGARLGAGFLNVSSLFDRVGDGVLINQLISDFGRTSSLVSQSKSQANAAAQNYQATRYDVLLRVNVAYFGALRSQALVKIAQKTVSARQQVDDQITQLAQNKLRSQLDVSFADVNVSKAKMLLIQSQNVVQAAFAELTRALGAQQSATYQLTDEPMPPSPQADVEGLVRQAMQSRPELAGLRLTRDAAYQFEAAERDLKRPTASFVGVAGYMPYIDQINRPRITPNEYVGAAVNLEIPIFNGHLFTARREEAHYRALESDQRVRDLEESISRDVRNAWANAQTAYQNLAVTAEFLREATMALDLAHGRFDLQLSSIVELTDSELNQTEAEIESLSAQYDYQSAYAALQYAIGLLR